MKLCRKLTALLIALTLLLTLCACEKKEEEPQEVFDARTYVDGLIRTTYLGEYPQEYLDLVGITEDTARSLYEHSLYLAAYSFAYIYNIEYPEDFYEEIEDLYREIYSLIDYEVVALTRYYNDSALAVQVDIAPSISCSWRRPSWTRCWSPSLKSTPRKTRRP